MVMSGSNMAGTIESTGIPLGLLGDDFPDFCDAVGNGAVGAISGVAPFTTTDSGTGNGTNAPGSGVGLTGIVAATLGTALVAAMTAAFGQAGISLPSLCTAVATGFQAECLLASLDSLHTPVHDGQGVIDVGSVVVSGSVIGGAVNAAGVSKGFLGINWVDVADVIGGEFATALAGASGIVTISGPGSSDAPGLTIPQGGSGTVS